MAPGGGAVEADFVAVDEAEVAEVRGAEGFDAEGVSFGNVAGGVDFVVQDEQDALAAGGGGSGSTDGVQEVERPVGADGGGGAHGADEDDGAVVLDGEVEEVGGFLHGVGAVGDDDAGGGGFVGEDAVDAGGEGEPVGDGDVGAADVGDLLDSDVGDLGDLRDVFDELEAG